MATTQQAGVIERMVVYMSDRCNGATTHDRMGFNKLDVDFGHKLADLVRQGRSLSFAQRAAAHKMLRKYAGQLAVGGFDIAQVPSPEPGPRGVQAQVEGTCYICGQRWERGALIRFANDGSKRRHHADCEPTDLPVEQRQDAIAKQERRDDAPEPTIVEHNDHLAAIRNEDAPSLPSPVAFAPTRTGMSVRDLLGPNGPIAKNLAGYEKRDEQIDCAEVIETALGQKRHVVVEAGTGTGKSFMYLAAAVNSGKKAIVSTADKSLQGQIWQKDIPFLQRTMAPFNAAILKGRANYLCLQRHEEIAKEIDSGLFGIESEGWKDQGSIPAWPKLREWAGSTQDGDIEMVEGITAELRERVTTGSDGCYGKRCPAFDRCWVEDAKHRAESADVVVVNHSLLLRDRKIQMETHGYAHLLPEADIVILDEAHHLEDQATDAFADELTAYGWRMCAGRIEDMTTKHKKLDAAQKERAEIYMTMVEQGTDAVRAACEFIEGKFEPDADGRTPSHVMVGGFHDQGKAIAAALVPLRDYMKDNVPSWLNDEKEREYWTKTTKLVGEYARKWARALVAPPEADGFVRYAELSRYRKAIVNVKPIEVADILRQALFDPGVFGAATRDDIDSDWDDEPRDIERATVVSTSATIAVGGGMAAWRARVGLDDADEKIVDSPFDYRKNAVLYIPNPERGFQPAYTGERAKAYQEQIADEMLKLVMASNGGAFLLFTSRRMMEYVYSDISYELQDIRLTPMKQGEPGTTRASLIERFKTTEGAVLFGVASFWEGVDVQGDALRLVVIDKMPFPQPDDPIQSERERVIKERGGNAFMELSVPFATIKLKQGFGRLIRTRTDRGAVAILDARLRLKAYGRTVIDSLPPARRSEKFENVSALFADKGGQL